MKFWVGCCGAIVGAVLGVIILNLVGAFACDGQDFGLAFFIVGFGIPAIFAGAVGGVFLGLHVLRYLQQEDLGQSERRKRRGTVSGIFIGLCGLTYGMVRVADIKMGPPADQAFLDNFRGYEAPLTQVVRAVQRDKKTHVFGILDSRYSQFLQEAHAPDGLALWDKTNSDVLYAPQEIDFPYYGNGSAISSDTNEGYAYLSKPPAYQVNALDDYQFNEHDFDQKAFRHIHGNWYLYREYEPG